MNQRLVWRIRQVTGAGFTGGLLLVGCGLAGLPGSLPLSIALIGSGLAGTALRHRLYGLLDNRAFEAYLTALPAGPLVAGLVLLVFAGASPGELQTLGGVVGLLALLNHLLRPIYGLLSLVVTRLSGALA
ncbi:hypothetical protein Hrd1104_12575 [Halorhabdus sp. CBA1104]|uniref:hypothetical protein n=1 Tax=unclassified Halorhabdus TaxID=2621901 RepID=UPI0012B24F2F|nr:MULTISPECIES: hypothetical protein [unclassified Halorhabdus]QGN08048.1 hypothetical protein Hrd1104_12575 [Halorhabdus sp. CBA1104]